jgi:antitoxin component YwqK of YwqJK toxin-antitoxin module
MVLNKFKIATFCIFAVFSQVVFSQVARPADTNFVDEKGRRQGPWIVIRPEGMSYIGQFKDNRPYGQFRHFDRFDRTISILDYFRDGYAAEVTHFHPNGNIRATGFYLEQLRDSTWEIFDTMGRIIRRENYLNGMLHGWSEIFDKDGNCVETQEWYRDLRNGLWWQRTERGTQTTTYKLNLSHGIYEAHFANGNLYIRGLYKEGLHEGTWYFYHEDGLLDRVIQFKNGRQQRKHVAVNVGGSDILLDSDSVAYMHTNGRVVDIVMLDGTTFRPTQSFDRLVKSFGTDAFFLANQQFFVAFKMYDSMIIQPSEDFFDGGGEGEHGNKQKALLKLKIPTPYDVFIDEEVIAMLQSLTSSKPPIEE